MGLFGVCENSEVQKQSVPTSSAMAIKAELASGLVLFGQTDFGGQLFRSSSVYDHVFRTFPETRATRAQCASALRRS